MVELGLGSQLEGGGGYIDGKHLDQIDVTKSPRRGGLVAKPPTPYSFGYDTEDEYGNKQFHKEEGDSHNIKTGSYGYTDANGLFRRVNYVADGTGFHVTITTNEPGTAPGRSADAMYNADSVVVPPVVGRASASGHVLAYAVAPSYLVKATPYESLALANLGYPAYIHGEYGRRKRNAVYQQ
ncbi:hypothetical protein HPB51_015682 [Rhipicephalus microplus]|uniref:Cuticle protein n=1 Tax=Rhipicephalus microplus TaxID=6941 RepID=A0A9J6D6A0_RHIMP|nr:hypothetical protein HPB51_015682 [Rhipicephalus microplus]